MQVKTAIFTLCCAIIFSLLMLDGALAEKRVALVIGNSAYKNAPKLTNPANDATAMSLLLQRAGFDVVESRQNLGIVEMRRSIRDFGDKLQGADIAVVYFAGHGLEVDGTNYLVPVDATLERDVDVEDEAISLDRIVRILEPAKRLRLVILDACRDNPFVRSMKRTLGTRSIGDRGLAKVEPATTDTLIAFAAKAGSTASDGAGANSPFTTALVNNIATPGLDLRIAFGKIRDEVMKATGNKQEPFVYGSLGGTTVALVPGSDVSGTVTASPSANATTEIRRAYELVMQIGTKQAWQQFLSTYSVGLYADLARQQLAKLEAEEAKTDAARKMEEPGKAKPPTTPSQSAPAAVPKSAEAPRAAKRVVCNKWGCQEVKPGCKVEKRPSGSDMEDFVICK